MKSEYSIVHDQGVHIEGTVLWCDPDRPMGLSFLSHAGTAVSQHYSKAMCTMETEVLIRALSRGKRRFRPLVFSYGQPISVGNLALELLPSGFALGGAQVQVQSPHGTLLYSGAIGVNDGIYLEGAATCAADILIVGTEGADPNATTGNEDERNATVAGFIRRAQKEGAVPIVLCPELGVAQEVSYVLKNTGLAHHVHPRIQRLNESLKELGLPVECPPSTFRPKPGNAVLWPVSHRDSSGLKHDEGFRYLRLIPDPSTSQDTLRWTRHPTAKEIETFVARVNPNEVITIGPHRETCAQFLRASGWNARSLITRPQLSLQV